MVNASEPRDRVMDAVRALACIGVILCHIVSPFRHHPANSLVLQVANFLDALSRPAVGVFFMLAGYFALRRPGDAGPDGVFRFYGRKLVAVVVPTAAAVVLYMLFLPGNGPFDFRRWLRLFDVHFILNSNAYPLWFMYPLIFYFLLTPILRGLAASRAGLAFLRLVVVAWFLLVVAAPSIHFYGIPLPEGDALSKALLDFFDSCVYLKHIGWFLIGGYCLDAWSAVARTSVYVRVQAYITLIVAFVATAAVPYYLESRGIVDQSDAWRDYVRPNIFFLSVLALVLGRNSLARRDPPGSGLARLAGLAFPAYLVHSAVILLVSRHTGDVYDLRRLVMHIPAVLAITYVLALCYYFMFTSVLARAVREPEPTAEGGTAKRSGGHLYLSLILFVVFAYCARQAFGEQREAAVIAKTMSRIHVRLDALRDLRAAYREMNDGGSAIPATVPGALDARYRKWKTELTRDADRLLVESGHGWIAEQDGDADGGTWIAWGAKPDMRLLRRRLDVLGQSLPPSLAAFAEAEADAAPFREVERALDTTAASFAPDRVTGWQWAILIIPVVVLILLAHASAGRD